MDIKYDDLIGIPFLDGGRTVKGLDCWGLAKLIYQRIGIDVGEYNISSESAHEISLTMKEELADKWIPLNRPEKGCLVIIRLQETEWANHCGVVLDNSYFIHAWCCETGVVIDRLRRWKSRIIGYYQFKGGENK